MAHLAPIVSRRSGTSLYSDLEGFEESLVETHGREFIGLPSGCFPRLDSMLDGWQGLGLLAAQPGIGKTTLLLQTGLGIVTVNEDAVFLFVSLEMGRDAMKRRLVSQTTRIPYRTLRKGEKGLDAGEDGLHFSEKTRARLRQGLANLRDLAPRIAILDSEDFSGIVSTEDFGDRLVQKVEAFKAKTGCSRAFVVVDHLGKLPTGSQGNLSTLERDDAKISSLLAAQRRLGSDPIVVISQVRKSDFGKPGLESAKGSAEISYSVDFYLAAWRTDEDTPNATEYGVDLPKETYFDCAIVKGRDGMIRGRVSMKFLVDEHRIEEVR
jgi:replicative DNA helicase